MVPAQIFVKQVTKNEVSLVKTQERNYQIAQKCLESGKTLEIVLPLEKTNHVALVRRNNRENAEMVLGLKYAQ